MARVRDPLRLRFIDWVRRWPPAMRRHVEWVVIGVFGVILLAIAFRQQMSDRVYPEPRTQQMLDSAAAALARGHLSARDGTGARELYNAALALDPDRQDAQLGLQRVGTAALAQAALATEKRRFAEAHANLQLARELSVPTADADRITERLRQLESQVVGVDQMLGEAEAARAEGRLDGDAKAALPLYQRVLALQPSNNTALEGREDALSDLLQQAQQHLAKQEFAEGAALVARVREYDPGHVGLPDAQAALTQARDSARSSAKSALKGKRLDEVAEAYRTALALDPDDAEAREGLQRLTQEWAQRSKRQASDFDFDRAEASLEQARTLDPDSPAVADAERHLAQSRARRSRLPLAQSSAGRSTEVQRLLEQAREAQARGDLLTPPGDSAYDHLRRARAIAPDDPVVRSAQSNLLPAARSCYDEAMRANRLVRAEACLDARDQLGDSRAGVLQARNRLALRWIAVGEERLRAGEIATAQRALNTARGLDPQAEGLDAFADRIRVASRGTSQR
jgi:tetratricopeptide (TPR) repeat protein